VEDPVRRGQRQVEQVKIKIGMQMDERTFQAALLETNVSSSDSYCAPDTECTSFR
jgi:rapamycin-insensitive companion of mTOR